MNTSGTGTVFAIGYWLVLAMTIACAVQLLGDLGRRLRAPRTAALAVVAVVVVAGAVLLAVNDAHGIPILAGLAIGADLALVTSSASGNLRRA